MKKAIIKTLESYKKTMPILFGTLLLVNIINPFLKEFYASIFSGNYILDPLIGALAGSISFGMPATAYLAGGELLKEGVSLLAVSAFMMAWTTVGVSMLPLEMSFLGKRFAIARNIVNFFFAIIISILTVVTVNMFV